MTPPSNRFDQLAGIYRTLELLAFGYDLERARFNWLDQLRDCRELLVLGEGDGRALVRILAAAPAAQIHCVDLSSAMLAKAAARISPVDRARITFDHGDALRLNFPAQKFDAVVTLFFLDCFPPEQVEALVGRLTAALQPGSLWLFSDFALPARGYARFRARAWLRLLYAFFRWQTGLAARALPPSEEIIAAHGWRRTMERELQQGLLRSVVFHQIDASNAEAATHCSGNGSER